MNELTADLYETALALIQEYGVTVVITTPGVGSVRDPLTQKTVPAAPTTQSPKVIIEDKGIWLGKEEGVKGEKKLTIAGKGFTLPAPGSSFVVGGVTYHCFDRGVKSYYSEDVAVLHEVYGTVGRG